MYLKKNNYLKIVSDLEDWANYEKSSNQRDISKLEGIRLLLFKLGNPEKKKKIIHIAGTNGKGSTAIIISSLLKDNGFFTGCYTSPHLVDIRERISINGIPVDKKVFSTSASIVLKIATSFNGKPHLSYFDILTAIAFHVFMVKKVDWIVLETGLGGRLDSTNVSKKELCILTKVGIDHQNILGSKLTDIAEEKIGISRSEIPIVISHQKKELKAWLKKELKKRNVPVYFAEDFFKSHFSYKNFFQRFYSKSQIECIETSLCAMQILFKGNTIQKKKWMQTAQRIKVPGRLDLRKNIFWKKKSTYFKQILIDGSHNKDSILELLYFISKNEITPFTLILGMVSDKLVNTIKNHLKNLCFRANNIIFTTVISPRSATTNNLERFIFDSRKLKSNLEIKHVNSAEEALEFCIFDCKKTIVIAGSFFLAGEIIQILKR